MKLFSGAIYIKCHTINPLFTFLECLLDSLTFESIIIFTDVLMGDFVFVSGKQFGAKREVSEAVSITGNELNIII